MGTPLPTSTGEGEQPYKYGGKEYDQMLGLDQYDFHARQMDGIRFTGIDPLAEKYYSWSPYVYCANNPFKYIDPTGEDYWSTNDPEEIARFLEALKAKEVSNATLFDFNSWTHISDNNFVGGLTYNDETNTFHTSYVSAVPDAESSSGYGYVVNGVSVKGVYYPFNGENGVAGIAGHTFPQAKGNIEPTYIEFYAFLLARGVSNILFTQSTKIYSEATYKAFERQLKGHGEKSLMKSRQKILRRLLEHQGKVKNLKYPSSVEREIRTFKSQLKAIDDLLKNSK